MESSNILYYVVYVAVPSLPDVATEAVVLAPSVPPGQEQDGSSVVDLAEFSISRVINRQFSGQQTFLALALGVLIATVYVYS